MLATTVEGHSRETARHSAPGERSAHALRVQAGRWFPDDCPGPRVAADTDSEGD